MGGIGSARTLTPVVALRSSSVCGDRMGDEELHDFTALYASIESSIEASKEKYVKDRNAINTLQVAVDSLNDRCAVLGRQLERERQERCQDTQALQDKMEAEKVAQEERETAAYHQFSEQQSLTEDKLTEQKRYLDSAISYVRTSVDQEK